MGRGKGKKGGGKKGKGKHQAPAEEEGWEGGPAAEQHLYRIKNRYHVAHAILKTACDQEGSAFAKQHKTNDFAFLGGKCMKALLTRDNHHLLRRPGVGLSEAAGSLQAGADVLQNLMDLDISILQQVLQEEKVVAATAASEHFGPLCGTSPQGPASCRGHTGRDADRRGRSRRGSHQGHHHGFSLALVRHAALAFVAWFL